MKWSEMGPLLMTARRPTFYGMICMDLRAFWCFLQKFQRSFSQMLTNHLEGWQKMYSNHVTRCFCCSHTGVYPGKINVDIAIDCWRKHFIRIPLVKNKNSKSTRPYYTKYVPQHSSHTTITTTQCNFGSSCSYVGCFFLSGVMFLSFFFASQKLQKKSISNRKPSPETCVGYMSFLRAFT